MKSVKKAIIVIAVLAMIVSCVGPVSAASDEVEPLASKTLTSYAVYLKAGSKSGELRITIDVAATGVASSLGVSYIEIYEANNDDTPFEIIYGTTSNGLKSSGPSYTYTYSYTDATPGVEYYAIVSVFAIVNGTFDSRRIQTTTVTAPT